MYLMHPEALAVVKHIASGFNFILYFLMTVCITLVISEFLYRFIEIPFMDYRENFRVAKQKTI
jgi:peptidoglycan/LPS O-acetylase OafA/YrhL